MVAILMQKKRAQGAATLGTSPGAPTHYERHKGRSREGKLEKYTKIMGVLFFVFAIIISFIR